MEKKTCKKCGKELPDGCNDKLCQECQEKRKSIIKKILIGAGTVGVVATAVLAGLASRNRKDGIDFDYEYDDDFVQKWIFHTYTVS